MRYILTQALQYKQDVTQCQYFSNGEQFSFSKTGGHTKIKEPSLTYYLPKEGISFKWNANRIWTWVANFISYNANCNTKYTSFYTMWYVA